MPDYRRYFVPGGTYFFTLVADGRRPILCGDAARGHLGRLFRECQTQWPFTITALVLLPDHLHAIWSLPPGDAAYPKRWGWIKKEFTKAWLAEGHAERPVSVGRLRDGRRGVWQPKYWEHTIEDEVDFERHFDYLHYNPVKHGHARCPRDWPWSSFQRWVQAGVYPGDWACGLETELPFQDIADTVGEL